MLDHVIQGILLVLSLLMTYLVSRTNVRIQNYGVILGICIQPIWFYIGYKSGAWVFMVLATAYMVMWLVDFYRRGIWQQRKN